MLSPVPPDPPTVAIREISARSISVWWSAGFDGNTPITGFHLECKSQSGKITEIARLALPNGLNEWVLPIVQFQCLLTLYYFFVIFAVTDSWVDGVRGSNILPWERETAINDLRPFYTYNIRMFTKNDMGLSKPSNELTITTKEAGISPDQTSSG